MSAGLFFLISFLYGFALSFPFGPASLEMVRLSIAHDYRRALYLALGTSMGDACWALIAFAGVHGIFWTRADSPLGKWFMSGGMLLCLVMGWKTLCHPPQSGITIQKSGGWTGLRQLLQGSLLAITYPLTIGSWTAGLMIFRRWHVAAPFRPSIAALFCASVMAGYLAYFLALILLGKRLRDRLPLIHVRRIQRLSGLLFLLFALFFMIMIVKPANR